MWKVCDCKDQSLPLSISVSVSDCKKLKPLWRLALAPPPFHSLHLPFSDSVSHSLSDSVSVHCGLLRDSKFLSSAGRLKLQSRSHAGTPKWNKRTLHGRECADTCKLHPYVMVALVISKPWILICCYKSLFSSGEGLATAFSSRSINWFIPKVLDEVEVRAGQSSSTPNWKTISSWSLLWPRGHCHVETGKEPPQLLPQS